MSSGWTGPQVRTGVGPGPDLSPHLGFLIANSPSRINGEINVNNATSHINNDMADHNGEAWDHFQYHPPTTTTPTSLRSHHHHSKLPNAIQIQICH